MTKQKAEQSKLRELAAEYQRCIEIDETLNPDDAGGFRVLANYVARLAEAVADEVNRIEDLINRHINAISRSMQALSDHDAERRVLITECLAEIERRLDALTASVTMVGSEDEWRRMAKLKATEGEVGDEP